MALPLPCWIAERLLTLTHMKFVSFSCKTITLFYNIPVATMKKWIISRYSTSTPGKKTYPFWKEAQLLENIMTPNSNLIYN